MRKSNSKLLPVLRAMDAYTAPASAEAQQEPRCAIIGCDAWPVTTCVCCNRDVCADDIAGMFGDDDDADICIDCVLACMGGIACKVVM